MRHLVSFLTLLMLAGCAPSSGGTPAPSGAPGGDEWTLVITDGGPGGGPGISVAEALGHGPTDDLVSVTGALFVDADGMVRLCDAIAESFPPQCGGDRLVVIGLALDSIANLQNADGVQWAESVTLFGSVE